MNPKVERALGTLLRGARADEKYLAFNDPRFAAAPATISLTSSAFVTGSPMPKRYAGPGIGDNISPPLGWTDLPAATRELVLIMQDPDAPLPRPVTHVAVTTFRSAGPDSRKARWRRTRERRWLLRAARSGRSAMPGRGRCSATVFTVTCFRFSRSDASWRCRRSRSLIRCSPPSPKRYWRVGFWLGLTSGLESSLRAEGEANQKVAGLLRRLRFSQ